LTDFSAYTEKELLKAVAEGDKSAFHFLYKAFQAKLYRFIFDLVESAFIAEDIFQDVFLKVWEQRARLPEIENFNAYIYTLARNKTYDGLRRVAHEEAIIAELAENESPNESDTDRLLRYQELRAQLHRVIDRLPPQQKQVYLLSREGGLKYDQIASRLKISVATVNTHMSRALQAIRNNLNPK
jgi:RNA polymerase sigma-70 factor (family 1)